MRKLATLALATACLMLAPSALAARRFHYGVTAGEITSRSAIVWARPDRPGGYTAEVARDRRFKRGLVKRRVSASRANDLTVQKLFRGLRPGSTYFYRFIGRRRAVSAIGRFRTAPPSTAAATIRFGWSGDADSQHPVGSSKPFFGTMGVYGAMASEGNAFNINLGDTIYSDSEVPNEGTAAVGVRQKWAKYRQNLRLTNYQRVRAATGIYDQWDDHEFINDFSRAEFGDAIYSAGVKAFRTYMPVRYRSTTGLYRSFRWGRNLQLFFLDERSFRSAKASANHVCDNPSTHKPDNAPTAPQSSRTTFALVDPEFTQPVSQQCLNAINDPGRTFLGSSQLALFERAVQRSTARWKVVVNEVPIQQFYGLPYDRWEGYAAERTRLLTFLHDHVKNVVFVTTDVHADMVNDVRFQTLEPGGPRNSGIEEFTTGPVATGTFSHEIDQTLGRRGDGQLITGGFFKPQPPAGVGMQCVNTNIRSFGEVKVTSRRFTVQLLDARRRPIKDTSGAACGPFTLSAR